MTDLNRAWNAYRREAHEYRIKEYGYDPLEKPMKKTYAYHKPSTAGIEKIATLRRAFSDLHDLIEATAPASREKSVVLTNLETTAMWAIKAVVCNDPESVVDA